MTAIRSHFTPDQIEVNEGDTVNLHITNLEQAEDQTHGFTIDMYNINVSLEPGKHENVTFKADMPGVYPDVLHRVLLGAAPRDDGLLARQAEEHVRRWTTVTAVDHHVHLPRANQREPPCRVGGGGSSSALTACARRALRGAFFLPVVAASRSTRRSTRTGCS